MKRSYVLDERIFAYTGCTCNGNVVMNDASRYPEYDSCQKKCEKTSKCEYFGVWDNGHCMGWDSCGSCQSSGHTNEVFKQESGTKSFYLSAMRRRAIIHFI